MEGADQLKVTLSVNSAEDQDCETIQCGLFEFGNIHIEEIKTGLYAKGTYQNVCPDGWFLTGTGEDRPGVPASCLKLAENFGFDTATLPGSIDGFAIDTFGEDLDCRSSAADINEEITAASNNAQGYGGTVLLPACKYNLDRAILMKPNVIVQGAGVGRTILNLATAGTPFQASYVSLCPTGQLCDIGNAAVTLGFNHCPPGSSTACNNFVVRDLTLTTEIGRNPLMVYIENAENVLLERVELRGYTNPLGENTGAGGTVRYANNLTYRYNASSELGLHQFSVGHCFRLGDNCDVLLERHNSANAPNITRSGNVTFYSNIGYGSHGSINSHAENAESAGNRRENCTNCAGPKFVGVHNLYLHHNRFYQNIGDLKRTYTTRVGSGYNRNPERIRIYYNHFEHELTDQKIGSFINIVSEADKVAVIDNKYIGERVYRSRSQDNDSFSAAEGVVPILSSSPKNFNICEGTTEHKLPAGKFNVVSSSDPRCVDPGTWWPSSLGNASIPDTDLTQKDFTISNYPNPFNPRIAIELKMPEAHEVSLRVYDVAGREVAQLMNGMQEAGTHIVFFEGSNYASGLYLYRIEVGSKIKVGKFLLVK